MACMKLGSKSEAFHRDGHTWFCSSGLQSDCVVEVGESSFHLHKFPLLTRSKLLEDLIAEQSTENGTTCVLQLDDLPGGTNSFLLVAKFCYGVRIELDALNIVRLRCAAEYLGMTEEYGEGNLILQTENFLNEVFSHWTDSLQALETCEEVLPLAEEIHIVSRCIHSLAMKACADPSLFSWPMSARSRDAAQSPEEGNVFWNGIWTSGKSNSVGDDWWYEDVSFLTLPLYKRLIQAVISNGMKPEKVAGALMCYARRYLPLLGRQSSFQNVKQDALGSTIKTTPQADQRNLLEEIVELLPDQKGIAPTKFLLRLLRTAILLHAGPSCRENLEKRIGAQLDQAVLEDLLIPNVGYSSETLYDIDCVQRMLDHFMMVDRDDPPPTTNFTLDEGQLLGGGASQSFAPVTLVANLIDNFLAEVAPDVNFRLAKFQSLAALIPDYARHIDDGIYRAIDIYLKAHPWLTDSERELLCRLMNCQKLSLEASTHAAQNERLPLRVIVQVLFFEQLRLRTSVAGWFYVSDNLENSQNPSGNLALTRNEIEEHNGEEAADVRERIVELEKECMSMKQEIEKLMKNKGSWNTLLRKLGFGKAKKQQPNNGDQKARNGKEPSGLEDSTTPLMNGGGGGAAVVDDGGGDRNNGKSGRLD